MEIRIDDLRGPEIKALLEAHLDLMRSITPPESVHALDLDALRAPDVTFWTLWDVDSLVCCGALKELDPTHGEIKSMHTAVHTRGRGFARTLLEHIIAVAKHRGYARLSLETGATEHFLPARSLYAAFGFEPTDPFGNYQPDPHSAFMTREFV